MDVDLGGVSHRRSCLGQCFNRQWGGWQMAPSVFCFFSGDLAARVAAWAFTV